MDNSRAEHISVGWVPALDWNNAATGIPSTAVMVVQDVISLAFQALPFVHVDDWLIGKNPEGLTIKGWIGTTQKAEIIISSNSIRLTMDPEILESFTTTLDDNIGILGWFSELAGKTSSFPTIQGTILNISALDFVCRKSGSKQSGWEGARFKANARRNVFRLTNTKGAPLSPWLHPAFNATPKFAQAPRLFLEKANWATVFKDAPWITACEQVGLVQLDSVRPSSVRPITKVKADPSAVDLESMDFRPTAKNIRGIRNVLPILSTIKSDPTIEEIMELLDKSPNTLDLFKGVKT